MDVAEAVDNPARLRSDRGGEGTLVDSFPVPEV